GLASAIARAGVDPTAEPRPLLDALRSAIAVRRGYLAWDADEVGWVVDLLSPDRERFRSRTLEEALAWRLVWPIADEQHQRGRERTVPAPVVEG
ncbi:MAG: hypothetical protein M3Q10_12260, partial [Chloroflexota bacterium]|nr:hypothetical protein [Chloroflexota bacterium]